MIAYLFLASICYVQALYEFVEPQLEFDLTSGRIACQISPGHDDRVVECKGIPYAAPPIGNNRFRPPQPAVPWAGTIDAKQYGNYCPQWNISFGSGAHLIGNENCLFGNVFKPAYAKRGDNLPIIVEVHGGGQNLGAGGTEIQPGCVTAGATICTALSESYYHGDNSADPAISGVEAIWITFNYRLNVFGWATFSDDAVGSGTGFEGGYGMLDQIAMLQWVQDNAEEFGGDPKKVTIMAISGGATGIANLLATPLTDDQNLFSAAWMGSPLTNHMLTCDAMRGIYDDLLDDLNCTGYASQSACLRGVDVNDIFDTFLAGVLAMELGVVNFPFGLATPSACIGSDAMPLHPADMLATTNINKKVRIIMGNVDKEQTLIYLSGVPTRAACSYAAYQYATISTGLNNSQVATWVEANLDSYPNTQFGWLNCISELYFVCSSNRLLDGASENNARKMWRYIWERNPFVFLPFAAHSWDNSYLTAHPNYYEFLGTVTPSPTDYQLMRFVQDTIVTFADKKVKASLWPQYESDKKQLNMNVPLTIGNSYRSAACDLWNNLPTL